MPALLLTLRGRKQSTPGWPVCKPPSGFSPSHQRLPARVDPDPGPETSLTASPISQASVEGGVSPARLRLGCPSLNGFAQKAGVKATRPPAPLGA